MGIRDTLNRLAGLKTPDPDVVRHVAEAKAQVPRHVRYAAPVAINYICQELEQSLQPGEEIRFIGGYGRGAYAVTNRRVVSTSSMGMEKRSLPIDDTLSVYIDRDLTETNLRFTAIAGKEIRLSGVNLSPNQERKLREALPPGAMF